MQALHRHRSKSVEASFRRNASFCPAPIKASKHHSGATQAPIGIEQRAETQREPSTDIEPHTVSRPLSSALTKERESAVKSR